MRIIQKKDFIYEIKADKAFEKVSQYNSVIEKLLRSCDLLIDGKDISMKIETKNNCNGLEEYLIFPRDRESKIAAIRPYPEYAEGKIKEVKFEQEKTFLKFEDWNVTISHQAD
jgi:hypothetical protein